MALLYTKLSGRRPIPPFSDRSLKESLLNWLLRHSRARQISGKVRGRPVIGAAGGGGIAGTGPDESLVERLRPKETNQRSVLFLHNSYYHFFYLARALRKRGWHALSVSFEPPDSPNQLYYHGEDLNLWHADYSVVHNRMKELFEAVCANFKLLHWHGENKMAIFDHNFQNPARDVIPWDFLELRRRGVRLGHSISGCLTGQRQSDFNRATGGVCNKCVWQLDPMICSDAKNAAVGRMLAWLCDLNAVEGDWPLKFRQTPNAFWEPLTYCVDADLWRPDIDVSGALKLDRQPGEILVYHAVGNYSTRDKGGRNIKGTPAVVAAIERLSSEKIPVRLIFKTGVPSRDMRFYQVQADIVVDQLNYGRPGATARECLMLGRPTVCYINPRQPDGSVSPSLSESPLISATEETIYEVLRELCLALPERRHAIGRASRAYALRWYSADACAARFERVYDRIMSGEPIRAEDV
jgi:hypothetical protein